MIHKFDFSGLGVICMFINAPRTQQKILVSENVKKTVFGIVETKGDKKLPMCISDHNLTPIPYLNHFSRLDVKA